MASIWSGQPSCKRPDLAWKDERDNARRTVESEPYIVKTDQDYAHRANRTKSV